MAETYAAYSEADRVWSGPPSNSIYKEDASLGTLIFQSMKNWPRNICQIWDDDGFVVTFEQELTWAIRIAQFLKGRGLTHKDVIGIAARHSKLLYPLGVACLMNGTPFHSPHSVLDEATIKQMFSITKPNLIFCDGNVYEKIHAATIEWQPEIYTLTDHVEGVPNIESLLEPTTTEMSYQPEPLVEGGNQTAALLCSSGTTGLPKVVCISHRMLMFSPTSPINSETIVLLPTAMDWLSGVAMLVFNTVQGYTRILSRKQLTPEYIVYLVQKYKVDFICLPPCPLSALVHCPEATVESLTSIRSFLYGGGAISHATLKRCQELCVNATMMNSYGTSEAGFITYNIGLEVANSLGGPKPDIRVRILGENGENLTHNQVGEICVHNGLTWKGYYENPEATRQIQDSEGWIHTGDMGYFNEQNCLFIVDRCKDILKYQHFHYWPGEIEATIMELPQVKDVCVVGVHNEVDYDAAGALVVLKKGSTISAKEIVEHVAKNLPAVHKQLHAGVQFTNELPANPNGKVVRKLALEMFNALKAA
ncbi:probable 4-coumarate--CoA ligase 3 [Drosophila serrata]|uniref:probable 4-coumarate--CoA ligase 3 n=1 Tax=Drosophila serrata TaxID=7274 RepID=UPI000A1D2B9A|nr:probable 4-coumarate--CoA ligase 3 [Drosophila serrata]